MTVMCSSARDARPIPIACFLLVLALKVEAAPSPLFARGYAVLPAPQRLSLSGTDLEFGPSWQLETTGPIDPQTQSVLSGELMERHKLGSATSNGKTRVRLELRANSVDPGEALDRDRNAIAAQAYKIEIKPGVVNITANASPGIFYGIETLAQLLKPSAGKLWLPEGVITDWPDLKIRNIYWDDAHHLDRPDELKRAIRQAAFFKVNGFVIKLEGHFQFAHAPAMVEPYALSAAELQELTTYALRYHVQLIPYLDGPSHIAFILKHPEFAGLRSFPESNYELCATNPASYQLLQGMFQDLLDANRGVDYVFLSTDEAYYIGWAKNVQCDEKSAADRYGSRGKLLAEFVAKVGGYLHDRGRKVVFWGEYPMVASDIAALPSFMINGEVNAPEFDTAFRRRGISQMIFTSVQGEERVFPEYFLLPASRRLHATREMPGRVEEVFEKISFDQSRVDADLQGVVVAGWADAGQHTENFWLGYVAGAAAAWHPASSDSREIMAAFSPLFYGWNVAGMDRAYRLLSYQAQFWMDSWETVESKSRKPIWGYSQGIFTPPHPAHDQSLPVPPVPGDELKHDSAWSETNARRMQLALDFLSENDEVLDLLHANLLRAGHNQYNIEVLLSNALLCRQNLELLLSLGRIDKLLESAANQAGSGRAKEAVVAVDRALETLRAARDQRNRMLAGLTETWYKSWYPRVAQANGRTFLHDVDDVKDHFPDRTVDMSYLVLRQLQLPLTNWTSQVQAARNRYAAAHNLPSRNQDFNWLDMDTVRSATGFDER